MAVLNVRSIWNDVKGVQKSSAQSRTDAMSLPSMSVELTAIIIVERG